MQIHVYNLTELGKVRQDIFLINISWFEFFGGRHLIILPMKNILRKMNWVLIILLTQKEFQIQLFTLNVNYRI